MEQAVNWLVTPFEANVLYNLWQMIFELTWLPLKSEASRIYFVQLCFEAVCCLWEMLWPTVIHAHTGIKQSLAAKAAWSMHELSALLLKPDSAKFGIVLVFGGKLFIEHCGNLRVPLARLMVFTSCERNHAGWKDSTSSRANESKCPSPWYDSKLVQVSGMVSPSPW